VTSPPALAEQVLEGSTRAIARTISLLEDHDPLGRQIVRTLYPRTGRASRVGVTGPPGVGKSTLLSALTRVVRRAELAVGVISVDPSSPFSEGAVLGDRLRLSEHFLDSGVFIRSMGTRGHLGGLSEAAAQSALVLDAAGMNVVFLETVGVGQSEVEVASVVDTVVLVLMPGSGDSIQALKAGVMEIPDIIVINKKDHPRAMATARDIQAFLNLSEEEDSPWAPPVLLTDAVGGEGVEELWEAIQDHGRWLSEEGRLERRRQNNVEAEVAALAANRLQAKIKDMMRDDPRVSRLLAEVHEGRLDPFSVVEYLIASFGGPAAGGAPEFPGPPPNPNVR